MLLARDAAWSEGCDVLGQIDLSTLRNGQLFYRSASGWVGFDDLSQLSVLREQAIEVVYVIRDLDRDPNRSGVLVIKSGTFAPDPAEPPNADRVQLVRDKNKTDNGCPQPANFPRAYISGKGYEDYHAFVRRYTPELRRGERSLIEKFHIQYARQGGCLATNSLNGGRRNNASQFSFDPSVVDEGVPRGGIFAIFNRAVYQGPAPYAARRTEIQHYHLSQGLQCVSFVVRIAAGTKSFLYINDLEGRQPPPSSLRQKEKRLGN